LCEDEISGEMEAQTGRPKSLAGAPDKLKKKKSSEMEAQKKTHT
jgi:hypothetical protein